MASKRNLYRPAQAQENVGQRKNRKTLAQGRLISGSNNVPGSVPGATASMSPSQNSNQSMNMSLNASARSYNISKLHQTSLIQGQLEESLFSPRRAVPKVSEPKSPTFGCRAGSLDLSDSESEQMALRERPVEVLCIDASRQPLDPDVTEVDIRIGVDHAPVKVVCHSPARVINALRDSSGDSGNLADTVTGEQSSGIFRHRAGGMSRDTYTDDHLDPYTAVQSIPMSPSSLGDKRVFPAAAVDRDRRILQSLPSNIPQPNFDDSDSEAPDHPVSDQGRQPARQSERGDVKKTEQVSKAKAAVSTAKDKVQQSAKKKKGRVVSSRYMSTAKPKSETPLSARMDKGHISDVQQQCTTNKSVRSLEPPQPIRKVAKKTKSSEQTSRSKPIDTSAIDPDASMLTGDISRSGNTGTSARSHLSQDFRDQSYLRDQSTVSVADQSSISSAKHKKKKDLKSVQEDLDKIWVYGLQWTFLKAKVKKALHEQEKQAMAQMSGLHDEVEKLRKLKVEKDQYLARLRHANMTDHLVEVQRQCLGPVTNQLPSLQAQYRTLAQALDTTRHHMPTHDIHLPENADQYQAQLEGQLLESERLLGEISTLTGKDVPSISELANTLQAMETSVDGMETELKNMDIYWCRLRGLPRKVYWPVKVVSWGNRSSEMVDVYSRSDNAIIKVSKNVLIPFPGQISKIKGQAYDVLKRKHLTATLKHFELDLQWALDGAETPTVADLRESLDAQEENPGSETLRVPDKNEEENPGSETLRVPDKNEEENPRSETLRVPDKNEEENPRSETLRVPDKNEEENPRSETLRVPDKNEEENPGSETLRVPDKSEEENPGSETSRVPDKNEEENPRSETSRVPDKSEEENPEFLMSGSCNESSAPCCSWVESSDKELEETDIDDDSDNDPDFEPEEYSTYPEEMDVDDSDNDSDFKPEEYSASSEEMDVYKEFDEVPDSDNSNTMSDVWPALNSRISSPESIEEHVDEIPIGPDNIEPDCEQRQHPDEEYELPAKSEILCDMNIKEIFVRKVLKSDNVMKKSDRVQNQRHACLFCNALKSHIQDHMIRLHKDKEQVKAIQECTDEKQKDKLKDLLRAEGDHLHNKRVFADKKGELLLSRRPTEEFNHNDYGPCLVCKEWLLKKSIKKHLKSCKGDSRNCVKTSRYLKTMSDVIKGVAPKQSRKMLVTEVFTIMSSDDVGCEARNDELICRLGEWWLRSCVDNKKKRAYWASQHMRLMARLLIAIRTMKQDNLLTMWDVLRPKMFETYLVPGALEMALPDMDDIEDLKSPTNLIKLKHDLIRMCEFKSSVSAQMHDNSGDVQWKKSGKAADSMLLEIKRWWKVRCTKLARKVLLERKLTKKEQLPNPQDIKKLGEFLTKELGEVNLDEETVTYATYKSYVELLQSRLLTYNKRRTGEIEDILLEHYQRKLEIADLDEGLMGDISETDRYLMDSHDLIQTRGKAGRVVPVLIPVECKPVMDFLAKKDVRRKLNLTSSYLFASNTTGKPIRAYDSLKRVSHMCGLDRPQDITSTNMRKYMATLAQVMNLSDSEVQQMCRHMGHTTRVHLEHYRTMSPYIERVTLGKILLMQDLNIQSKFVGKKLSDVEFIEIVKDQDTEPTAAAVSTPSNHDDPLSDDDEVFRFDGDKDSGDSAEDLNGEPERKKKKPLPKQRTRWTPKENEEIQKYFAKHLSDRKAPKRADCLKAKQSSFKAGGDLHKRPCHLIVKKVSAMNHSKKK